MTVLRHEAMLQAQLRKLGLIRHTQIITLCVMKVEVYGLRGNRLCVPPVFRGLSREFAA